MKYPTDEEITTEVLKLWPEVANEYRSGEHGIEIERLGNEIHLSVYKMYDRDGMALDFYKMLALSRLFDSMLVEEYDTIANGGCETCDYGSRFGFVFRIAPGAPFDPSLARAALGESDGR